MHTQINLMASFDPDAFYRRQKGAYICCTSSMSHKYLYHVIICIKLS